MGRSAASGILDSIQIGKATTRRDACDLPPGSGPSCRGVENLEVRSVILMGEFSMELFSRVS